MAENHRIARPKTPDYADSAEDSTLFSKPDLIEVLKDLLALHFARSHELEYGVRAIVAPGLTDFMDTIGLDSAWLKQAHLDRFGYAVTDLSLARERLACCADPLKLRSPIAVFDAR